MLINCKYYVHIASNKDMRTSLFHLFFVMVYYI